MSEQVSGSDIQQIMDRMKRFESQLDDVRSAIFQMARTEERVAIILEQQRFIPAD